MTLRTPLTVIIATHSTLKVLASSEEAMRVDLLDRAQAEAERLNRFIGNLLDMTKLESGQLNITLTPVDVADVVEAAVERAAPLLANHLLAIRFPPDLGMAMADFMLLEQVFFNLIDNAAKYGPAGSTIAITGASTDGRIVVEIADQGPGVPPDARDAVFDKFTRLKREDSQRPGTGLGLAICRGFLAAIGGDIAICDPPTGSGAIFSVSLAAWAEAAPSARTPPPHPFSDPERAAYA